MSASLSPLEPPSLRPPFAWPTLRLDPSTPLHLKWKVPPPFSADGGWLRITTSIDDREEKFLSISLPRDSTPLGHIDLKFAHSLQPFQFRLGPSAYALAAVEGLVLSLSQADSPLWILGQALPSGAQALSPHLLPSTSTNKLSNFLDRLASPASAQTFGWMEGCVLDALCDLSQSTGEPRWLRAMEQHLSLFISPEGDLIYEDPRGKPADGRIYGIEGTLPFAPLARIKPDHPLLELALEFFAKKLNEDGSFAHPEDITAEGSYTIAYPLAVLARTRHDTRLAQLAAQVLRQRRQSLRCSDGIWLRYHVSGEHSFRSWARGVAWYLLGLSRSLPELQGWIETDDLKKEFQDAAAWTLSRQRPSGLWGCYLDDAKTPADTSGSAGIAAAFAQGWASGLLQEDFLRASRHCWSGLLPWLTPDGFLDGAAQSNRGGEKLQRSSYRVLSPMGMGLMGQLHSALKKAP